MSAMSRPLLPLSALVLVCAALVSSACSRDPEVAKKAFFDKANAYAGQQKYEEAKVEYLNAIQQDPKFGEARLRLAQTYMRLGDPAKALGEFVKAADLLPNDATAQLSAGNLLLAAKQYEDAQTRAKQVLKQDPRNVDAQLLLGSATAGMKDVESAITEVEEAVTMDPARAGPYSKLGTLQLARGNLPAAEKAFKNALSIEPNSSKTNLALGNFYLATGRLEEGEKYLKQAVALDPKSVLANRALVSLYVGTNRPKDAEGPLKALADSAPDSRGQAVLGKYYSALGRLKDARTVFEKLQNDTQFGPEARVELARIDVLEGHAPEAHKRLDAILQKDPNNVGALVLKGSILINERKLDEALTRIKAAVAADPTSVLAQYLLGILYQSRKEYEGATQAFLEVLKLNPRAAVAEFRLAEISLATGRANPAVEFGQRAVKAAPGSPAAHFVLAKSLIAKGEYSRAETELRTLAVTYPKVSVIQSQLGNAAVLRKDTAAATRFFTRALELDPNDVDAIGGLVLIDVQAKRTREARARVEAAIGRRDSADLRVLAASVYSADKDVAKAEEALRKALDLAPAKVQIYSMLGDLYVSQNRLADALQQFKALAVKQPKSVSAHTMVAMILQAQGQTKEAEQRYLQVIQIDPRAPVAANNLAQMYVDRGENLDVALQFAQTAKAGMPNAHEVDDTLGWIYYKKGNGPMAVSSMKQAVAAQPGNAVYLYHLGAAYALSKDNTDARLTLEKALKLQPNFPGADDARKILDSLK